MMRARQRGKTGGLPSDVSQRVQQDSLGRRNDEDGNDDDAKGNRRRLNRSRVMKTLLVGIVAVNTIVLVVLIHATISTRDNKQDYYFPRYVRYVDTEGGPPGLRRLDLDMEIYPSKRTIDLLKRARQAQQHLRDDSNDFNRQRAEPMETGECRAQYDWQLTAFPSCNMIHEVDLTNLRGSPHGGRRNDEPVRLIGNGYYRDVWTVREELTHDKRVLKTLRYEHDFTERNYDRHRRDALAMERLTKSSHVVDIYGYCSSSGLFEFADGGDISRVIWPRKRNSQNITQLQKLHIATQVASAIADVHNVDREGQASMAHTDVSPVQFVRYDGIYRLNDFNRARFIGWNTTTNNEACGYYVGSNPGKNRSPEEYLYAIQSEKVDVYSMGNIFYVLMTGLWIFEELEEKDAQEEIKKGNRPPIPKEVLDKNDPIDRILMEAMIICHKQDPRDRATAREVETYLKSKLLSLGPKAMKN